MFLPNLQPLDQGVLEALKQHYRMSLVCHIVLENDMSARSAPDIVKALTIKDAVYWSNKAWEYVNSVTLKKSWRKLIPSSVAVNS